MMGCVFEFQVHIKPWDLIFRNELGPRSNKKFETSQHLWQPPRSYIVLCVTIRNHDLLIRIINKKDLTFGFFPFYSTWTNFHFGQIVLDIVLLIDVFLMKRLTWDILISQYFHRLIRPSLSMVWFSPCIIIMLHFQRWHGIFCHKMVGR
jgi:hypothetical protein